MLDDASDRGTIRLIKLALGAAIKQVTGDTYARAHATRSGPALDMLTPGWEVLLRKFLQGDLSGSECAIIARCLRREAIRWSPKSFVKLATDIRARISIITSHWAMY